MWKKSQKPVYASAKYVTEMSQFKNSVVLIDTRPAAEIEKAHIAGSVGISPEKLASHKENFPAKNTAPVVIVSSSDKEALEAFATIRGWGYKNAAILQGGMQGWLKAELATVSGQAATEIAYVPKPIPGAMSAAEFQTLIAKTGGDAVILDVRTEEEAAAGTIAGAINIPTDEVADRLGEIPQGKEVITYCSTGIRAEMAYITLKDKGFNAKFLNAKTEFANNAYTISEN